MRASIVFQGLGTNMVLVNQEACGCAVLPFESLLGGACVGRGVVCVCVGARVSTYVRACLSALNTVRLYLMDYGCFENKII